MFEHFIVNYGPSVLGGAVFLAIAWVFAHLSAKAVGNVLLKRANLDAAVAALMARVVSISILILAGIAVLEELGVEVASLIAALGIFGFAIAIGLRTTSTNFFTGVMLFILKPYKVGDYIEGERVEGVVESMSLFHTVVVTDEGVYVAVPNGAMWARSVRNHSRPRARRVEIDMTVERAKPFSESRSVIDRVLKSEGLIFAGFPPLIQLIEASENSATIRVSFWCDAEHEWGLRAGLTNTLRDSLAAAGIIASKIGAPRKEKSKKKKKSAPAPAGDDEG